MRNIYNFLKNLIRKASKKHGALGRLHLTGSGEWVWSSDEEESSEDEKPVTNNNIKPLNEIVNNHSSSSDEAEVDGIAVQKENHADDHGIPINLVLRLRLVWRRSFKLLNVFRLLFKISSRMTKIL